MKPTIAILICCFLVISFSACKKDDPKPKTKMDLLTASAWKITDIQYKSGTGAWQSDPSFATSPTCQKDDQLVFKANNTYEFNEGPSKCTASDPQIFDTGAWAFQDNETKLLWGSDSFSIDELTETSLIISITDATTTPTLSYRIIFAH